MLDYIDKKIIYELGKNSRQSYEKIARNIHSKKGIISYRINQLIENKIITKFVPVFALSKIGIISSKIYLKLQGLSTESEKTLQKFLISHKKIAWVAKSVGSWDLLLGFYTKTLNEFAQVKDEILEKFSNYISEYDISHIENGLVFNRDYLIDTPVLYRKELLYAGRVENIKLDSKDRHIIQEMKNNSRFHILNISKRLDLDPRTIINRIKNLKERDILQGYTVFLDLNKINHQLHKLCIYLKNYNKKQIASLISFLKLNPNTIHLVKAIGSWDFEVEAEYDNLTDVYKYISNLKNKFPKIIKQIDLVTVTDELKLDFFPEG